jgi:hypothetical protein
MKATALAIMLTFCAMLMAEISPFALVGEGNYAGKMATYASGDTIVFVTKPLTQNLVLYQYSHDGGNSWQTTEIAPSYIDNFFTPTLSYTQNETVLTYKKGLDQMWAISDDGETFNTNHYLGMCTFDPSVYMEKYNGQLKSFSLDLPYPAAIEVGGEMQIFPGINPDTPNEYVAPFHYTETEYNSDMEPEYFTGADVVDGIVRTNSCLYIKQTASGDNLGWPVFNSPVVIGGTVVSIPPDYPRDLVFRGGLIEQSPLMELGIALPPSGNLSVVGPPSYDPNIIIMVTVENTSWTAMIGRIGIPRRVYTDVWPNYPDGFDDPPSFRNNFMVRDTVWTHLGSGIGSGHINYVNNKLWLRGTFSGNQTWWSSQDIELIGDILIQGTQPPNAPDSNTNSPVNLVSNKNIIIKYGYRGPEDSLRYHTNMGSDDEFEAPAGGGIWIYASLYALGCVGEYPSQYGVFTFEYQHPHPSIPATWVYAPADYPGLYSWIDLHRYHYPQSTSYSWPANIDFPWYNPLWPEANPYLERGTVNVWGSIFQRRRGYLHREYDGTGGWNIDSEHYGGSSSPDEGYIDPVLGISLQTRNYPGAMGNGIGYKKNFNPDPRAKLSFGFWENDAWTLWNMGLRLINYGDYSWNNENYYQKPYIAVPHEKCFARKNDRAYYSVNDQLLYADLDAVTDISSSTNGDGIIRSIAINPDSSPLVYQLAEADSMYTMTVKHINAASGMVSYETSQAVPTMINDVCVLPNGRRLVAKYDNQSTISLWEITPQNALNHVENWQIDTGLLPPEARLKTCRLYMLPSANDRVEVFFYIPADAATPGSNGALYHAFAGFPVSNEDYTVPVVPMVKFSAYPNPMRSELKLQVENAKASTLSIDVYNIRGQLVHRIPLPNQSNSTKIDYTWDGKDLNQQKVASGIYVLRLMADNKAVSTKRICRY